MLLALECVVLVFETLCCSIVHVGQGVLPSIGEHPCFVALEVLLLLNHAVFVAIHSREHRRGIGGPS
jgi:hypothetical protein